MNNYTETQQRCISCLWVLLLSHWCLESLADLGLQQGGIMASTSYNGSLEAETAAA